MKSPGDGPGLFPENPVGYCVLTQPPALFDHSYW
jgi:hypothetical protein